MPQKRKNQRASARRKFLKIVLIEQGDRCFLCGHKHALTLHHMISLEDGGPNVRENLAGLCLTCHRFWHGIGVGCRQGVWKPLGAWSVTEMMPPYFLSKEDEELLKRHIRGALSNTIQAHGPITPELLTFATKRVFGVLKQYSQTKECESTRPSVRDSSAATTG